MSALVEQLPALIGVLLGTGGTIFATWTVDRARWRRQQSARWDERRLQAYSEFANAIKEVHSYALRVIHQGRSGADPHEFLPKLVEADVRRSKAWEGVLLLGEAPAVTAAREWRAAVTGIARQAQQPDDAFDLEAAVDRVNRSRDSFYEAARSSLGITTGFVPQAEWLANDLKAVTGRDLG